MLVKTNLLATTLETRFRDAVVFTLQTDGMAHAEAERIAQLLVPLVVPWIAQMEAWMHLEAERVMLSSGIVFKTGDDDG